MSRRGKYRYGLTAAEAARHAIKCPDCGARAAWLGCSAGGHYECQACARQWGWRDRRGAVITEDEYYVRLIAAAKETGWTPPAKPRKTLTKPNAS